MVNQLALDIRAARRGDAESWTRLLKTYRPVLESWASAYTTSGELSQRDLVQEAWMQIWKGLNSFRGIDHPEHVTAMFYQWLKITARNAMLTRLKHRNAKRRKPEQLLQNASEWLDPESRTPSSQAAHNEQVQRMRQAVDRLTDPIDRQILFMVSEDNLSLRFTARLLGKDYSAVRRRFLKVLSNLEDAIR